MSSLTILEDPLHVEAVCRTSFVIRTSFEIIGEFPCSTIVNYSRITLVDCI